jgi:hypothetical protein
MYPSRHVYKFYFEILKIQLLTAQPGIKMLRIENKLQAMDYLFKWVENSISNRKHAFMGRENFNGNVCSILLSVSRRLGETVYVYGIY